MAVRTMSTMSPYMVHNPIMSTNLDFAICSRQELVLDLYGVHRYNRLTERKERVKSSRSANGLSRPLTCRPMSSGYSILYISESHKRTCFSPFVTDRTIQRLMREEET